MYVEEYNFSEKSSFFCQINVFTKELISRKNFLCVIAASQSSVEIAEFSLIYVANNTYLAKIS